MKKVFIIEMRDEKKLKYYPPMYFKNVKRNYTDDELWSDFNCRRFIKDGNNKYYPDLFKKVSLMEE